MTAPRIDTVRKHGNQVARRITEALAHLEDLHTLGWYRHADVRAKERVTGGDPTAIGIDLDNHGDPAYRAAYTDLADTIVDVHDQLADAITNAIAQFTVGQLSTRRDQTADATSPEVIGALARQAKRTVTGEYTSATTVTQPLPANGRNLLQVEKIQNELEALRSAVRKSGTHPDRSRLTPLELTAWQAATGHRPRRRKRR